MPNQLLTPDVIAAQALATLYETCVMAPLVHRDYEPEFGKKVGNAITIRKPAVFVANEYNRASGIVVQDAEEDGIDMTLNHFADVSFAVTSEDMALNIVSFEEQLLGPAMEAIAQKVDLDILALRDDVTAEVGAVAENTGGEEWNYANGAFPWSDSRVLVNAGVKLTQAKVPLMNRRLVTGPLTAGRWMAERTWRQADKRGSTEGLQEASMGNRVSGFDPYQTQHINVPTPGSGVSTTEVGVAFHETAFALAFRPLEIPRGAEGRASVQNYKGFSLRVIYGYDMDKKQDVVSIDCLYGTKTLDPNRAVLIKGADGA